MNSPLLLIQLLVGISVAAAAGYLGSFMVLKRMSLVGDALSHVALPGMAVALMFHFSPMLGAFAALAAVIVLVWYLEENSRIYPEALIGVLFTTSLALGVLLTPEPDLLEALFGDITKVSIFEGVTAVILSLAVIAGVWKISRGVLLETISEELARSIRLPSKQIRLFYLLFVGLVVALGISFVGTLLMGAVVIIPAASAKNISRSLHQYYAYSIGFGVLSALIGLTMSFSLHIASGPAVVLTSVVFFLFSYIFRLSP
jgi:ABC-type Mn2+/Zn2+ transport system permease subunit